MLARLIRKQMIPTYGDFCLLSFSWGLLESFEVHTELDEKDSSLLLLIAGALDA